MFNPELLTAYGVAGLVIFCMMLTALKIIRDTGVEEQAPRTGKDRTILWPLAPARRQAFRP
jgi:hypothetical protein